MARQKEVIPDNLVKLSPSSFSFDWKECRRCYWLKHRAGVVRPSKPMAGIFTKIDAAMRAFYHERTIVVDGIAMVLDTKVRTLRSAPFFVEGLGLGVFISGKNDALAFPQDRAENDVAWCTIPDFKTSEPKPENVELYANQLEGYAYCLEHPEDPKQQPIEVRGASLMCFTPSSYRAGTTLVDGKLVTLDAERALVGSEKTLPIPRNAAGFERFLADVVVLLNGPIPAPNGVCTFCEMDRETARAEARIAELEAQLLHMQCELNRHS